MVYDNGIYREPTAKEAALMATEWNQAEQEYWRTVPYEDAVDAEIRKRYSISQEFAILRQREDKAEEYAEYYAYCEECKAYVKNQKSMD